MGFEARRDGVDSKAQTIRWHIEIAGSVAYPVVIKPPLVKASVPNSRDLIRKSVIVSDRRYSTEIAIVSSTLFRS